jgi:radical SAM protein with 4Fe4S-binding SPASM domain
MHLTKRKIGKLIGIIKRTRPNADFLKFVGNFVRQVSAERNRSSQTDIPMPTTLMLELTNKCNLHCVTCPREYDYGKAMSLGNMDTDLAIKIIDETYPYLQSIGLTGMGETLFAPNLLDIAKYVKAKKKSIVTFISTNANMEDFAARITPVLPFIDTVQVSTDGIDRGYEDIRHGASFSLLNKNLRYLIPLAMQNKVDVMFNMVINRRNYLQMPLVIKYAAEIGVKFVNFTYFNLASVTAIPVSYYEFFSSESFCDVLEKTRLLVKRYPQVEVTGLDFVGSPSIRKCPLMWNHFQINYDGEMPPCCAKPFSKEYSYGNVAAASVKSVINSEAAKKFRRQWEDNTPNAFCSKCHFVNL